MKRIVLLTVFLLSALTATAVPAPNTPYPYKQPDGTVIMLVNHGDEFYNWVTCGDRIVEKDALGYYRPVYSQEAHRRRAAQAQSLRRQAADMQRAALRSGMGMGEKHFLVILIEFPDMEFTVPNPREAFERMLNQPGYSENGGTGSVRDFYMDNSSGAFRPTFDVYGPVKVPNGYAYYGEDMGDTNDLHPDEALFDACNILDETLDFSQYDLDGDQYVDNVFFYFAGHNQAEGGGEETIWPHKWALFRYQGFYDGVRVYNYACASEYTGSEGERMAGIGTFVHEFGHVIGLPDFYDTDYEKNGSALHPGSFSTMAGGNYLNEGRTPCCFTSVERQMLGWMPEVFPEISASGEYSLGALTDNSLPYTTQADVVGEQFLYEYRNRKGWDSFLPEGLVIYHMDRSENICHDNVTAYMMWTIGSINTYAVHPCCYIISSVQGSSRPESTVFPGQQNVSSFVPVAWSGNELPVEFTQIRIEGDRLKMSADYSLLRQVSGFVKDATGRPLEGAELILGIEEPAAPGNVPRIRQIRPRGAEIRYRTTSGADGSYQFFLNEGDQTEQFRLSVSLEGYIEQAQTISVGRRHHCDFMLRPIGSPSRWSLKQFDLLSGGQTGRIGYGENSRSIMGASYFPADELRPYSGMRIKSVSFVVGTEAKAVHLVIDTDTRRLLTQAVSKVDAGGFTEVDVWDRNLYVSAGSGMYFGYAVKDAADGYPLVIQNIEGCTGMRYASYDLDGMAWQEYDEGYALLVAVTLVDEAATKYVNLGTLEVNSIRNPKPDGSYVSGDIFAFQLVEALHNKPSGVLWYYDGVPQSAGSVQLTSGSHVIKAHLTFPGGEEEDVYLELNVME